jgi:hypothetical protein
MMLDRYQPVARKTAYTPQNVNNTKDKLSQTSYAVNCCLLMSAIR